MTIETYADAVAANESNLRSIDQLLALIRSLGARTKHVVRESEIASLLEIRAETMAATVELREAVTVGTTHEHAALLMARCTESARRLTAWTDRVSPLLTRRLLN